MDRSERQARAAALLAEIEAEMRRVGLWERTSPSPAAFSSPLPFCYDTLSFTQWVQFVFLARMKRLIAANAELPMRCQIAPMAEESFRYMSTNTEPLLGLLRRMDEELTVVDSETL